MNGPDLDTDRNHAKLIKEQVSLLTIAEGFFQSSVLFALLKLQIFERIGDGGRSLLELAGETGARPETLARLLNAGVALNLLATTDGTVYRVADGCRSVLLPSAGVSYLGNWLRNLDYFRRALSELERAVLTSGPTVEPSGHLGVDGLTTREFTLAMHNYAALRGKELTRYLDTSQSRTLLDLGCGPGTYAFNLGLKNPGLQLYLLDLPEVLAVAREVQAQYGLENDIRYLPLDVTKDEIPGTYDIVLVSNTLHMLGEKDSRALLQRLYASVNAGGSVVIQAQYLRDDRLGGRWPVLLDLIQLCITAEGRNHSVTETTRWLEEAGFSNVQHWPMGLFNTNSFLRAYKGAAES